LINPLPERHPLQTVTASDAFQKIPSLPADRFNGRRLRNCAWHLVKCRSLRMLLQQILTALIEEK
jgi:hypothetical protein